VKRSRRVRVAVRGREVDGDGAGEVGSSSDVIEKRICFPDFAVNQMNEARIFVTLLTLDIRRKKNNFIISLNLIFGGYDKRHF
jgi:hypothetical protein